MTEPTRLTSEDEDSITTRLKFYSKIQQGEKIEQSPLSVSKDSFFTSIYRTLFGSKDRNQTLDELRTTVNNIFLIIDKWYTRSDKELYLQYILVDLNKLTEESLVNMEKTYDGDKFYSSSIQKIHQSINSYIYSLALKSDSLRKYITSTGLFKQVNIVKEDKKENKQ